MTECGLCDWWVPSSVTLALFVLYRAWQSVRPRASDKATIAETLQGFDAAEARVAAARANPVALPAGIDLAPGNSVVQRASAIAYARSVEGKPGHEVPRVCLVTGGTGFVGQRLVEMLVERGAEKVISFDIVPKPKDAWEHPRISYVTGDITDSAALDAAFAGVDCVWHNAAAVGPFHPHSLYDKVNFHGTINVIEACRRQGVPKCVMSSSPSTRFTGEDVDGLTEDEMPQLPLSSYMQAYAGSKARGEIVMREACSDDFLTCAVAPHQVYGPRDNLFTPNILEAAGSGRLRVFSSARTGGGFNRVCFTHVDNYCHGLIIAEKALYKGSNALGKFYIVTDGDTHPYSEGYHHFWVAVDQAAQAMGFAPLFEKAKLPDWFLMPIGRACDLLAAITGINMKLNSFNVRVLTMHRWFRIDNAERDLKFKPVVAFSEGWADAIDWFKKHWLPGYQQRSGKGMVGIASQSQRKIDIQAGKKKE